MEKKETTTAMVFDEETGEGRIINLQDNKNMNEEETILGELKVQLDYGNEDVISNILSRRGYDTLIKFISKKEDKAREEGYDEGFDDCFQDLLCKYNASGKRLFTRWLDEELSKLKQ